VGMPGAGKGLFIKAAKELGIKSYIMGDVIRLGALKKYGSITPETTGKFMEEIRAKEGREAVAKAIYRKIIEDRVSENSLLLIDGIRCVEELEFFKDRFYKVILIAVLADLENRFRRIVARKRVDDIIDIYDFLDRESREKKVGVIDVVRKADYYFINNYSDEKTALAGAIYLLKYIMRLINYDKEE